MFRPGCGERWRSAYGDDVARQIAERESEGGGAGHFAQARRRARSNGRSVSADSVLPTGSIRLAAHGRIEDLPGYA